MKFLLQVRFINEFIDILSFLRMYTSLPMKGINDVIIISTVHLLHECDAMFSMVLFRLSVGEDIEIHGN
jgi:hypothetical protein